MIFKLKTLPASFAKIIVANRNNVQVRDKMLYKIIDLRVNILGSPCIQIPSVMLKLNTDAMS